MCDDYRDSYRYERKCTRPCGKSARSLQYRTGSSSSGAVNQVSGRKNPSADGSWDFKAGSHSSVGCFWRRFRRGCFQYSVLIKHYLAVATHGAIGKLYENCLLKETLCIAALVISLFHPYAPTTLAACYPFVLYSSKNPCPPSQAYESESEESRLP